MFSVLRMSTDDSTVKLSRVANLLGAVVVVRDSLERPRPRDRTAPTVWLNHDVNREVAERRVGEVDMERLVKLGFPQSARPQAGLPFKESEGDSARVGGSSAAESLPGRLRTLLRRLLRVLAIRCREPMTEAMEGALDNCGCDALGARRQPGAWGGEDSSACMFDDARLSRFEVNVPSMLARRGWKARSYDCVLKRLVSAACMGPPGAHLWHGGEGICDSIG